MAMRVKLREANKIKVRLSRASHQRAQTTRTTSYWHLINAMYKMFEVAERVRRHNPRALAVDIRSCRWNNHAVYDCIILSVNIARCI